jgi:hypothetical protein
MRLFSRLFKRNTKAVEVKRIRKSDLAVGDCFRANWDRVAGGICTVRCLGNDPERRRIFIEIIWGTESGEKTERDIWHYDSPQLVDFYLLNQDFMEDEDTIDDAIEVIRKKIDELVAEEDYEAAAKITTRVKNITKIEK